MPPCSRKRKRTIDESRSLSADIVSLAWPKLSELVFVLREVTPDRKRHKKTFLFRSHPLYPKIRSTLDRQRIFTDDTVDGVPCTCQKVVRLVYNGVDVVVSGRFENVKDWTEFLNAFSARRRSSGQYTFVVTYTYVPTTSPCLTSDKDVLAARPLIDGISKSKPNLSKMVTRGSDRRSATVKQQCNDQLKRPPAYNIPDHVDIIFTKWEKGASDFKIMLKAVLCMPFQVLRNLPFDKMIAIFDLEMLSSEDIANNFESQHTRLMGIFETSQPGLGLHPLNSAEEWHLWMKRYLEHTQFTGRSLSIRMTYLTINAKCSSVLGPNSGSEISSSTSLASSLSSICDTSKTLRYAIDGDLERGLLGEWKFFAIEQHRNEVRKLVHARTMAHRKRNSRYIL